MRTRLAVHEPFRLDLTVAVLRRLASNPVEVWDGHRYLRAFETPAGAVAWSVAEDPRGRLAVELEGPAGDAAPWRRRVARALGTGVDLAPFHARARRFPEVAALARAFRGVKPPRFAALHEALAGALLFQQVSLAAAMATLRRMVLALAPPVQAFGAVLHPFPSAAAVAARSEADLRAFGMSAAKARALRAACGDVAEGRLVEEELEALPSEALHERLLALEGVGPWTAALVMLRGFGRTDRFPPGDVAAERLLRELGSDASAAELLEALGDVRGVLYYLLFLHRMSEGGGRSAATTASAQRTTKGSTSRSARDMSRGGALPRATRRSSR